MQGVKSMAKWKCPLGHEQTKKVEVVSIQGIILGMPKTVAICEVCGVLFDWSKTEKFHQKP